MTLVGLAKRAGVLAEGRTAALRRWRQGKLLILAEDLSPRERRRWEKQAKERDIPVVIYGTKAMWGRILGRRPTGILLVTEPGLARRIQEMLRRER